MVIAERAPTVTVTDALPLTPPEAAVTVSDPGVAAVNKPLPSIVPTPPLTVQVGVIARVLPLLSVTTAVNWPVSPAMTLAEDGETTIVDSVPAITVTSAVAVTLPELAVTVPEPTDEAVYRPFESTEPIEPVKVHAGETSTAFPFASSPETEN